MKPTTYFKDFCFYQLFVYFYVYLCQLFVYLFWVCFVEERHISRDLFFVVTSKMPNRHVPQINQATAELHRNCRATVRPQRNWPQQSSDGKMMRAASLTFKKSWHFLDTKMHIRKCGVLPLFLTGLFGFRIVVIFWNVENVLPIENRCQSTW